MIRHRSYDIMSRAVDEGVSIGYTRALKHLDEGQSPTRESLEEHIAREVMGALCEVFAFDEVGDE